MSGELNEAQQVESERTAYEQVWALQDELKAAKAEIVELKSKVAISHERELELKRMADRIVITRLVAKVVAPNSMTRVDVE